MGILSKSSVHNCPSMQWNLSIYSDHVLAIQLCMVLIERGGLVKIHCCMSNIIYREVVVLVKGGLDGGLIIGFTSMVMEVFVGIVKDLYKYFAIENVLLCIS